MNRIDKLFQDKKERVLNVYFTAGYPQLNDTTTILEALETSGADLIEIGIPLPMARPFKRAMGWLWKTA